MLKLVSIMTFVFTYSCIFGTKGNKRDEPTSTGMAACNTQTVELVKEFDKIFLEISTANETPYGSSYQESEGDITKKKHRLSELSDSIHKMKECSFELKGSSMKLDEKFKKSLQDKKTSVTKH